VGKTRRYVEEKPHFCGKVYAEPFTIGRRANPDINGAVKYLSVKHRDKFALGVGFQLVVKTP